MGSHHSHAVHESTNPQKKVTFEEWKESCKIQHENFYNQLGDRIWDQFNYPSQNKEILQKIAIPLFGKTVKENFDLELTDEQEKLVHDISNKCVAHSVDKSQIRMSVIFVFAYIDENIQTIFPVIRVMSHGEETFENIPDNIFIDHLGRVYYNWAQYKAENTLIKSWLCVPENGYYASQNNYEFLNQSSRGQFVNSIDHYTTYSNILTSITLSGGIVLTFFPPTAPIGAAIILGSTIIGAPSAIYGVGRSVDQLVDRHGHEQSISLTDSEARQCWLLTASSLLSIGPMVVGEIIAKGAQAGRVVSAITRAAVTTLNATTATVAGLGVMNSIYELSKKDNITTADILQLVTSIFFFSHSLVTMRTASSMINDAQERQITTVRNNLLSEQQAIHDVLLEGTKEVIDHGKIREMHGRAQFIREMKNIKDVKDFYSHFDIKTDGQLYINSELTIHPKAFLQINEGDRLSLMKLSRRLRDNEINLQQFDIEAAPIQKEFQLRLERHRTDAETFLKTTFAVEDISDIRLGGNRLGTLKPAEIDRLELVVKKIYHNADGELIELASEFAQKQGASNFTEYCATGEYAVRQIETEVTRRQNVNSNPQRPPGVEAKDFYKSQVVQEYLTDGNKLDEMNNVFNQLREEVDAVNTGHPKFNNSMDAANHYDKHPLFPKVDPLNNLSAEMYFDIATEMAGGPVTNIRWTQDGSELISTFNSDKYGATAIRYDNLANRTSVIATLISTDVSESILVNPRDDI